MSVIVKNVEGKYKLLCKGADSVMLERISFEMNGIPNLKDTVD
jgi:magnesium-transporting ATPase (P-type)